MSWGRDWERFLARKGLLDRKASAPRSQAEYRAQVAFFRLVRAKEAEYPELRWMHSSQNGLFSDPVSVGKAVAAGLVRGVPDIHLPLPRGGFHGLWIELKIAPNVPTKEQVDWIDALRTMGHYADACYGWEEAWTLTEQYITVQLVRM